jgi:hypothetical protein
MTKTIEVRLLLWVSPTLTNMQRYLSAEGMGVDEEDDVIISLSKPPVPVCDTALLGRIVLIPAAAGEGCGGGQLTT